MNTCIVVPVQPKAWKDGRLGHLAASVVSILRLFAASGNPCADFLYERVTSWHIEINADGRAMREVGLDENGNVIVIAPWRDNNGYYVNSDGALDPTKYSQIPSEQFQHEWESMDRPKVAG
jgi:hypothetical protein